MLNILIIDDDNEILEMLKEYLETKGHNVLIATDGKEGFKEFKRHPVDLVITDIIMPEMEGMEIIREFKVKYPNVKIIAMSGGGIVKPDAYLKVAQKLGANKIMIKPINLNDLSLCINELFSIKVEDNHAKTL